MRRLDLQNVVVSVNKAAAFLPG